jgi:hypothetical protein
MPLRPHPRRRVRAAARVLPLVLAAALAGGSLAAPLDAPLAAQPIGARLDTLRDDRNFSFVDRGPYRAAVPRPEALLGYALGDRNTQYAEQQQVLLAIANAARDRVRVESIAVTPERRQMRLFIVSAPENIARLDEIRRDLDRIADPRGASAADLDAAVRRTPAVVWISESVHGNESPGFESGMQLLYQLAASDEPATVAALRNAILVLNPSSNPDGHERFSVWYNSVARSDPEPSSFEHDEPWSIQGRYNHYRFDMNRDVIASSQAEVQGILRGMLRWHPQVAVDQHGQTTNYFFPPAARPVNEHIGTASEKWLTAIGRANAAAFDRYGWMYYVRSDFDLYYPGYWDTWPSLTGATGMTYETDGGGWKGILWRREDGSLLSFRDGIAKHWVAAMATIETTAARSAERLRDYLAFRQQAVRDGGSGAMRRVVIVPGRDPARAAELAAALLRAGVEVRRTDAAFTSASATAYTGQGARTVRFEPGAYVIDLAQPQGKVARAILEPAPLLDTVFARTQLDRFARNQRRGGSGVREGYEFYDITAWSLPVAFGVEAYWTGDAGPVGGALLSLPAAGTALVAGEQLPVEVGGGIVGNGAATSAYLFRPDRSGASRLAFHLLAEGFRVAVANDSIEAGGQPWPRGTYIVRVTRNEPTLRARLDALARESGVEVVAVNTAFTERAQFGIGGGEIVSLQRPRVAILGDEGIAQTSYGAIWWAFERRYGIDFTHVGWNALGGDMSRYNVLIIPDGSAGAIADRLGKGGTDQLKAWVRNGGTLITMGDASAWAAREDVGLTTARRVGDDAAATPAPATPPRTDSAATTTRRPTPRERERAPEAGDLLAVTSPGASNAAPTPVPGSHFDAVLDRTHWLTFGYERPRLTVLVEGRTFLKLSREGTNVAVFPATGTFYRAGFQWPDNTERLLRNSALVIEEPLGAGHTVLFANEPMFRGWWRALDRLVMNAVVLGPAY